MNPRIRELAGQALDQAVPETWTTLTGEQLGRFQEKFAELIVRECANLVDNHDDSYPHVGFGDMIKKHFGVKQ